MGKETAHGAASRKKIYSAIEAYNKEKGYSISVREICEMTGIKSSSTVHGHLQVMKEQGIIYMDPNSPRTVRIFKPEALDGSEKESDTANFRDYYLKLKEMEEAVERALKEIKNVKAALSRLKL